MNWHQACELPYYHGSDLGANPTAEETTFKLWAPTACGVVVCLYATGTDAEPGAKELGVHEMRRGDGGVWAIVLPGNLHGTYYIYRIYFPDGRVHEVVDPYARSAGANGTRGMVVDLTQAAPDGWEQDRRPDIPAHARSVWEVHVADFSADGHSGVRPEWRGKFMGFTPDDTTLDNDGEHPTCLNYLKIWASAMCNYSPSTTTPRWTSLAPTAATTGATTRRTTTCPRAALPPTRSTARCASRSAAPWSPRCTARGWAS